MSKVDELRKELKSTKAMLDRERKNVADAHKILDSVGVPKTGVEPCRENDCDIHLQHRMRTFVGSATNAIREFAKDVTKVFQESVKEVFSPSKEEMERFHNLLLEKSEEAKRQIGLPPEDFTGVGT